MASDLNFVKFVCEQIDGSGVVTYKKMFGEYGVYCNGKIIGLICGNEFFLKKTEAAVLMQKTFEEVSPYPGAKPHLKIEDFDDQVFLTQLIRQTFEMLPSPRAKKTKKLSLL